MALDPRTAMRELPRGAVFGGLTGLIVGAINRNRTLTHASALAFSVGLGAALGAGESGYPIPKPIYEDRLVYVRP